MKCENCGKKMIEDIEGGIVKDMYDNDVYTEYPVFYCERCD